MKIIINHNENISPEESVEFVFNLLYNYGGVDELIKTCDKCSIRTSNIYTRNVCGVVTTGWAKLNKASLTFQVNREYN